MITLSFLIFFSKYPRVDEELASNTEQNKDTLIRYGFFRCFFGV